MITKHTGRSNSKHFWNISSKISGVQQSAVDLTLRLRAIVRKTVPSE